LKEGIKATYEWFLENLDEIKEVEIKSWSTPILLISKWGHE
jgi:hypothetical protein